VSETGDDVYSLGPFVHCYRCGGRLQITRREERPRRWCPACDRIFYHNPVPAAGGVITDEDGRVLLVRRRFEPRAGAWCLPAGFMEYDESPAECAVREIHEETGLRAHIGDVFGVYAGRDDPRHAAVLILYRMGIDGGELRAGDDASELSFFAPPAIPADIAFRAHREALVDLFGEDLAPAARPRD
jgi:ADP-ribose pyrophosphatase YjhB (NUDIX family)